MDAIKKRGRPKKKESRAAMEKVYTFRADIETQTAIERLMEYIRQRMPMGAAEGSIQAAAIRHGLIYAAGKLVQTDPGVIPFPTKT
jgi:hypothetical protein